MTNNRSALLPLASRRTPIRELLEVIERGAMGIALITDETMRLVGTVTDGDIRRRLLAGGALDDPAETCMNPRPTTVTKNTDIQAIRRIFVEFKLKALPVVDDEGKIADLLLVNNLLSIPLSNPDITEREREAVLEVLSTTDLSLGPKVYEFEKILAAYVGRKHAIAVNSGTSALHLIVKSLGFSPGDEVLTTSFSFIASANCLLYENLKPVFVDIEPDTYNIDPECIRRAVGPKTKAILAVDVFGQPARYDAISAIAKEYDLTLISDSCESLGAEYLGKRAGSFGVASAFAFYPNKQITTGEGGMILTDDDSLAELALSYRNQGRSKSGGWLCHERIGYNYRLSDINCALGIAQMERIDEILRMRQRVAETYTSLLKDNPSVHVPHVIPEVTRMSWFVYVIRLASGFSRADRDGILQRMNKSGIGVNAYFQPIHLQPFYKALLGDASPDLPITQAVSDRTIALPFHNHLSPETAADVVAALSDALKAASPK